MLAHSLSGSSWLQTEKMTPTIKQQLWGSNWLHCKPTSDVKPRYVRLYIQTLVSTKWWTEQLTDTVTPTTLLINAKRKKNWYKHKLKSRANKKHWSEIEKETHPGGQ